MVELSQLNLEAFATPGSSKRSAGGCGQCGSGDDSGGSQCGNGLEKIYPTTAVRFGYMRYIGEFSHAPGMRFTCGAKVVIQTKRGIEIGEQVSQTCSGCDKSVTRDQMRAWVDTCGEDSFIFEAGRILREATATDLAEYAHIKADSRARLRFAQDTADRFKLAIGITECECLFGGERIILYFASSERVDFRSLVKELATEYRTRIEMRQVGARDEARLQADFESCGREVCCKVFLKTLRPVSMRMAKVQKATLDPSQVSGRCGRLKCCLRYEHIGYEELDKLLPRNGVRIRTKHGDGVVRNRQILTQLVQIRTDANKLITVVAEDIEEVGIPAPPPQEEGKKPDVRRGSRPGHPKSTTNRGNSRRGQPRPDDSRDKPKHLKKSEPKDVGEKKSEDGVTGQSPKSEQESEKPPRRRSRSRGRRRRGKGDQRGDGKPNDPKPPSE